MNVLTVALEFAVLVFLGIFIVRIRLVTVEFRTQLAKFVMNVAVPCMICRSLYSQSGNQGALLQAPLLGLAALALLLLAGQGLYLLLGRGDLGKTGRFGMAYSNFTFLGFPVVEALYGEQGLFVFALFTLPIRLIFYPSGYFLLTPEGEKGQRPGLKTLLRKLVSPPTVAVAIGLGLYALKLPVPAFLDAAVDALGDTASVLGMLLVGMGMAQATPRSLWERRKAFWIVLARLLIAPLLVLGLFLLLGVEPELAAPLFLYGALPVPSLMTTFSVSLGRPEAACQDASAAVLASTLLSIVTLPVWAAVGRWVWC